MTRIFFWILGIFFLVLGMIGLLLPVVPQVPFLAAAAVFLAGGSKRFRHKLTANKYYQKHLEEYVRKSTFLSHMLYDE